MSKVTFNYGNGVSHTYALSGEGVYGERIPNDQKELDRLAAQQAAQQANDLASDSEFTDVNAGLGIGEPEGTAPSAPVEGETTQPNVVLPTDPLEGIDPEGAAPAAPVEGETQAPGPEASQQPEPTGDDAPAAPVEEVKAEKTAEEVAAEAAQAAAEEEAAKAAAAPAPVKRK